MQNLERARVWRKNNKDRVNDHTRNYYYRNLEASRKRSRNRRRNERMGPGAAEKAEELLLAQDNKCAICFAPDPNQLDHCHSTGIIRGVLCLKCNVGLGAFVDSHTRLQQAIQYLTQVRNKE